MLFKSAKSKFSLISVIALMLMMLAITIVHADVDWTLPYNNLSSDYKVTTENFPDPVPLGMEVVAWAGWLNPEVDEVKFRWMPPEGSGVDEYIDICVAADFSTVEVEGYGTVYQCSSSYTPSTLAELGDWGIQALFYDFEAPNEGRGPIEEQPGQIRIIARSFHAVPEVPVGTIMAAAVMLGGLGLFYLRRKPHTYLSKLR